MNLLKYIVLGTFFGVMMYMTEALSWFRIFEMFKFQSFHMYGIIGAGVVIGLLVNYLFKSGKLKDIKGDFHVHTNYSDGGNTIKEMAETAKKLGLKYIEITDNTGNLKIAGG